VRRLPTRLTALAAAVALAFGTVAGPRPAIAQEGCDPFQTAPEYDASTPRFGFGETQMTVAEIDAYLTAVDGASNRVVTAEAARSVKGTAIRYAIVGTPDRVTPAGLAAIRANLAVLQDPQATGASLAAAKADTPAILWVSGNVHGGEESGADASLHALYELASRGDCVVDDILANALVLILPTQNPDGRELGQRRNLYGFDMNRDWFARTQPETDGKLEVVRQYPPMLYIDAHEFGLSNYFFPPNADPEYHEIPDAAHNWINQLYSPAIAAEFDRQGIRYFHGAPYDFFAIVFGDTVPTEGFHAAGMTFEKESGDPISEREHEQFTSIWASLFAGAASRASVVSGWHDSWAQAYQQGLDGVLEDNNVFEPRHELLQQVPDVEVRNYFLLDDPARSYELQLLVRRLQRMDVEVRRLSEPLPVSDFHPYGDAAAAVTLPAGTYWIPLAQRQKHWVQAMLHEETWIPFEVTFDVTAWSNPLLMNIAGGWTGETVSPAHEVVQAADAPGWSLPADLPSIGLLENVRSTRGFEAAGQTRYLLERQWGLEAGVDYRDVTPADVVAGLPGIDVLVVPDGFAGYLVQDLGAKGKRALRDWVNAGGRVVAWQGGAVAVAKTGASTARFGNSHTNMPGTLVRVAVDGSSPLAEDVGGRNWVMYQDDRIMQPGLGEVVASFPAFGSADYATSGLTIGADTLAGSAAVVDEAVGAGRVVSFSVDPNFRAWTQGTQRMLWNAIVGADPAGFGAAPLAGSRERAGAEKAALDAAASLVEFGSAIRIRVGAADAAATAKVLGRHGAEVVRFDLGADVLFVVANRKDLSYDEHPSFGLIVRDLDTAGIDVRAASLP
jgi:hypothetical protein